MTAPQKAHDLPRPYRLAVPLSVVPTIDKLRQQGHKLRHIAKHLGVHENTLRAVDKRRGAYKDIPK